MQIELTKGKTTIVDDADYDWLIQWKWYYSSTGYAVRKPYQKTVIYMHRLILQITDNLLCDHINGNKLDNKQRNLRIVNKSQNSVNSYQHNDNKSGYKGVSWSKVAKRWTVYVKGQHIGYFINIIDAALAYNQRATEVFGHFAKLNDIKELQSA